MKKFNCIIFMLITVFMLATSVLSVNAKNDDTESYTLIYECNLNESFKSDDCAQSVRSFFSRNSFDGCYGNQLTDVAKGIYDSLVSNYASNKKTSAYTYTFKKEFTFNAEISDGYIVMNDELSDICDTINCSIQSSIDAFIYDHPEVFWLKNIEASYSISVSGSDSSSFKGYINEITIIPIETYSGASSKISLYNSAVKSALNNITVTENRRDTLKSIHDYICNNAYYNLINDDRVFSSEAFFIGNGGIVCEGYAKSFKVLCDKLGIPCVLVSGDAKGAHMWNYVYMDDEMWYLVDATWNDQGSKIYDTYFLVGANSIGFDNIPISKERTEKSDFSASGIFSFIYPVLSSEPYTNHTWESDFTTDIEPTCVSKGSKSIHCSDKGCTAKTNVTEIAPTYKHTYKNYKCITCGYVYHNYSPATCTTPKICKICGETSGKANGHKYENKCDTTCNICSEKRPITHSYAAATCTAPKTCTICKATSGKANGHKYTNACDTSCNTCKATRKITHSYQNVVTKATLTKNGKIENKCSVCGKVSKTTTVYYPKTIALSATKFTYNGSVKGPGVTVKNSQGKALVNGTDYTIKYSDGRKNVGKYTVTVTFKGNYSGTKTLTFYVLPGKTSKITPTATTTTLKATWNKVTGASGYKVELLNTSGKVVKTVHTKNSYYTFSKLTAGTTYRVKVTAYKTFSDKNQYSLSSASIVTATKPATPTLKVTSTKKGVANLSWSNVAGETGYQVYYATSQNGTYTKAGAYNTNTVSGSKSKLTSGKTYYFKVRACKKVGDTTIYGAWSSVKSVKIK